MSDINVKSDAMIGVWLDGRSLATVQQVRDWLAEVDRLRIPSATVLDECILSVNFRSEILDTTFSESELGVEVVDILVGMPR